MMKKNIQYRNPEGMRLDKFLSMQFPDFSRSFIQKQIKEGHCLVNGKKVKANYCCISGDEIEMHFSVVEERMILPEKTPLNILFEDEDLLVINKPRGMVVHPAPGHLEGTLVNAVLHHTGGKLSDLNGEERPGIVHRLDKDTTGLLLVAKNNEIHDSLAKMLQSYEIIRRYEAIVHNNMKEDFGTISCFLSRSNSDRKKYAVSDHGKWAVTHFQVLERLKEGKFTYVSCQLETGRTHQIRVHLASRGNPVLGDPVYGPKKSPFRTDGQLLHAREISFVHPRSGEQMCFLSDLPDDFKNILTALKNYDSLS